jgi:lipopolysaccharide assembly protein A
VDAAGPVRHDETVKVHWTPIGGTNMRWVYLAVIAILALVTLIFALQNFQSVTVSFLRLQLSAPLAVLIILIYLFGMATGGSAWALVRWAWQGSREA